MTDKLKKQEKRFLLNFLLIFIVFLIIFVFIIIYHNHEIKKVNSKCRNLVNYTIEETSEEIISIMSESFKECKMVNITNDNENYLILSFNCCVQKVCGRGM